MPDLNGMADGAVKPPVTGALAQPVPSQYSEFPYEWFKGGRYFRIYSPQHPMIHEGDFVLIGSDGEDGMGLRVIWDKESIVALARASGNLDDKMALKRRNLPPNEAHNVAGHTHTHPHVVSRSNTADAELESAIADLDDHLPDLFLTTRCKCDVTSGTFVDLAHSFNIPFYHTDAGPRQKFKFMDHGILETPSKHHLRKQYLMQRTEKWNLTETMRAHYAKLDAG